jgi:hypothetical protein
MVVGPKVAFLAQQLLLLAQLPSASLDVTQLQQPPAGRSSSGNSLLVPQHAVHKVVWVAVTQQWATNGLQMVTCTWYRRKAASTPLHWVLWFLQYTTSHV